MILARGTVSTLISTTVIPREHDYFETWFRVQVANPPYSANWSDMHFMEDERFNEYGKLAPKIKKKYGRSTWFIITWIRTDELSFFLPHGVLFRGAAEEVIRKHLI